MDRLHLLLQMRSAALRIEANAELTGAGLTLTQQLIVLHIGDDPGLLPRTLAERMRQARSFVGQRLRQCVDRRLVRKQNGNRYHDVYLHLTPRGQEAYARIRAELDSWAALYWGDLPPEDLAAVGRALTRILERSR